MPFSVELETRSSFDVEVEKWGYLTFVDTFSFAIYQIFFGLQWAFADCHGQCLVKWRYHLCTTPQASSDVMLLDVLSSNTERDRKLEPGAC